MSYILLAEHNNQKDIETVDPDGMQTQNQRYIETVDPDGMQTQNQRYVETIDLDGMQTQNQHYVETQSSTDASVVAPSLTNNVPSSRTSRIFPRNHTLDFLTLRKLYILTYIIVQLYLILVMFKK